VVNWVMNLLLQLMIWVLRGVLRSLLGVAHLVAKFVNDPEVWEMYEEIKERTAEALNG
jgi:hypothetical protein